MQSLRLALLGAFAFPAPLGSQRFFAEQASALQAAGSEVERFSYAAEGLTLRGLDPRKLAADYALGRALLAAHGAARFDAVLAHNAEAALLALALRQRLGIPVVYVAHTLWAEELETWLAPGLRGGAITMKFSQDAPIEVSLSGTLDRIEFWEFARATSSSKTMAARAPAPVSLRRSPSASIRRAIQRRRTTSSGAAWRPRPPSGPPGWASGRSRSSWSTTAPVTGPASSPGRSQGRGSSPIP